MRQFKEVRDLAASIDSQVQTLHDGFVEFYDHSDEVVAQFEMKMDT
jgi:hypothetical protein